MAIITFDEKFCTSAIELVGYIFEYIQMLLRSIIESSVLSDTCSRIWGTIYWLLGDLNLIAHLIGTSKVEIGLSSLLTTEVDISRFIGPVNASYGATSSLSYIGHVLFHEEEYGYVLSGMAYSLFEFIAYLFEFIAHLMQALPSAFPFA